MPIDPNIYLSLKKMLTASGQMDSIIKAFVSNSEIRIEELSKAISVYDHDSIVKLAHAIKGSCAMLGGIQCAAICEAIENASRKSNDPVLVELLQKLTDEIRSISTFLQNDWSGNSQGCCD